MYNENQALLVRIKTKKSCYNVAKWKREFSHRNKIMLNICEYPYQLCRLPKIKRHLTRVSPRNFRTFDTIPQCNLEDDSDRSKCMMSFIVALMKRNHFEKREIMLHRKKRKLGNENYDIEVSIMNQKLIITAINMVNNEKTVIDIPKDKSYLFHDL